MPITLPISRLINVDVVLSPQAAQAQDLSTLLVLGKSAVIDVVERLRTYSSLEGVAADFGINAPEYLAASLWFSQTPQPNQIKVGRWAAANTPGQLICGPLSSSNSLIATWNAIANGGFTVTIDGGSPTAVNGLDFSLAANLNAVAAVIEAGLAGAATCVYNSVYNRFEFTSATTGAASSVSFLSAAGGTDISDNLSGRQVDGAYLAGGIVAETAAACVTLFDQRFGQTWYGLQIPEAVDVDHLAVAGVIEASTNKHIYGVTSQDANILSAVSVNDIAYLLEQAGRTRTMVQYSSSSAYAIASAMARILTTNYNGNNTVITLMYKQEPGVTAESLLESQMAALEDKNCNVFVSYNNETAIFERGTMANGYFVDEVTGTDWLAVTIMNELYNLLYTSPTKIPQTDAGTHLLVVTIESVCSQGVINGLLAPGTWQSQGFGTLNQGDFMPKGFYVYAPPVATQTPADRAARKSVPIQVAAKLAGAVHTIDVTINVNR